VRQSWPEESSAHSQPGLGKSFDGWLPIGPCLVSTEALGDISKLTMTTHINDRLAQKVSLGELVYSLVRLRAPFRTAAER
jgi:2-keto-4-pentenoate hydratase/2-oxohepta-3-ene-1,7-dioic acid hydratase in catechol pathway